MTRAVTMACALCLAVVGCEEERSSAPFEYLEYRNVSEAPGLVSLRGNEISLEQGMAVRARVSAIGTDGNPLDLLDLRSADNSIFTADLGPRLGEYVFHAASPGTTELDVISDGQWAGTIAVEVLPQAR